MLFYFGLSHEAISQNKESSVLNLPSSNLFEKSDFFTGGNFGLLFGNTTLINISPVLGYQVSEKVQAGIGGIYLYYGYRDQFQSFVSHTLGGRVFSRQYLFETFFLHQEIEALNGVWIINEPRYTLLSVFVGGGYTQQISPRFTISILGLYNLNETQYTPYGSNPLLRVGTQFGL